MARTASKREQYIEKTVRFTVTGEAVTKIARNVWLSDEPRKAVKILVEGLHGMTQEIALEILTGRQKLIGENEEVRVVRDTAYKKKTDLSFDALVLRLENRIKEFEDRYQAHNLNNFRNVARGTRGLLDEKEVSDKIGIVIREILNELVFAYGLIGKSITDILLFRIDCDNEEYLAEVRGDDFDFSGLDDRIAEAERRSKLAAKGIANILGIFPDVVDIDNYVKKSMADDPEKRTTPSDIRTSIFDSGYIDRKGNFYGCSDWQHRAVSEQFVKAGILTPTSKESEKDSEKAADEAGWIRLSAGRFEYSDTKHRFRGWTPKQIDTAFDYISRKGMKVITLNGSRVELGEFFDKVKEL